jgi:hypothetical protein
MRRRQRAAHDPRPGDGRVLRRFRWWQLPGRALFHLRLPHDDGRAEYAVDVRHWQGQGSGDVTADLYRNGRQHASSKLPAAFPVEAGTIEVAMSGFGIKRCHLVVAAEGAEHQLTPDPASAEGRRARLQQHRPVLSRTIGMVSVALLLTGIALLVVQIAGPISQIPPIADTLGVFVSPVAVPLWLNIILTLGAAVASMERALRLRYHWALDAIAN